MKIAVLTLSCCILIYPYSKVNAQFKAGTDIIILSGTPVSIDSLNLEPTADLNLSGKNITVSHTPIDAITPGSNGSIGRVITINPALSFKGTIGLYYDNSELNGNTPTLLNLQYTPNTGPMGNTNLVTVSNLGNDVKGITGVNTIDVFKITAVDGGVVLPLHLLSFTALPDDNEVIIKWEVTDEQNLNYYEVEKSYDSKTFETLESIVAEGATHNAKISYQTVDVSPQKGWNYYRLKPIDNDQKFYYTPVVAVNFNSKNSILIFPNPASNQVTISIFSDKEYNDLCTISDITGRAVTKLAVPVKKGNNYFTVDIAAFASGVYTVKLQDGFSTKLVKE